MSKILLMTLDFPPRLGGIARYLAALCSYFQDRVRVIAAPEKGSRDFDAAASYPVRREKLLYPFFWPRWFKAVQILLREEATYDIVLISHLLPLGTAACVSGLFTRKPYALLLHGMDAALARRHPVKRFVAALVVRRAHLVITNSQALKNEIQAHYSHPRVVVAYPPLTVTEPAPAAKPPSDEIVILTVGRLIPRKGHKLVLDALNILAMQGREERLRYRIVGGGPEQGEIERLAAELGLSDNLTLTGPLNDRELAREYAQADLFVMPTLPDPVDREGFGMVYLEAAAFGVPAIAAQQPGVSEAVFDGQTGLLVPPGDAKELAKALSLLIGDPALRRRLGEAARLRARRDFTPAGQFGPLANLL